MDFGENLSVLSLEKRMELLRLNLQSAWKSSWAKWDWVRRFYVSRWWKEWTIMRENMLKVWIFPYFSLSSLFGKLCLFFCEIMLIFLQMFVLAISKDYLYYGVTLNMFGKRLLFYFKKNYILLAKCDLIFEIKYAGF